MAIAIVAATPGTITAIKKYSSGPGCEAGRRVQESPELRPIVHDSADHTIGSVQAHGRATRGRASPVGRRLRSRCHGSRSDRHGDCQPKAIKQLDAASAYNRPLPAWQVFTARMSSSARAGTVRGMVSRLGPNVDYVGQVSSVSLNPLSRYGCR